MMKLSNAFSISMLPTGGGTVSFSPIGVVEASAYCGGGVDSYIGHADTAYIVGGLLGRAVAANRASLKLAPGDRLIVAQYAGPRLPEGAKTLPEGAHIDFYLVTLQD